MRECIYPTPYGVVQFPLHQDNIAISSTGGADSTILLHLLLLHQLTPEIAFIENAHASLEVLKKCLHYLEELHGRKLSLRIVPRRVGEGHNLRPQIIELAHQYGRLYTGVTMNSSKVTSEGAPLRPSSNPSKIIITPFLHLDKRAPIYLYYQLGLTELLAMTHSCTQHLTIPCQQCYACRERNWAQQEVLNDL